MLKKLLGIWELIQSLWNASQAFNYIVATAGVVAVILAVFWKWAQGLQPEQKWLFVFATFCFLLLFVRLIWSWWQKRNIERIPDLIEHLDKMTLDYTKDGNHISQNGGVADIDATKEATLLHKEGLDNGR